MAKFGLGMGGGGALPAGGIPRPMPRPAAPGQTAAPGGGWLGSPGSEARYDMVMQLLQNGLSASQGANSPLLALLAPIATSVIGARATKVHEDKRAADASAMTESLLGPAAGSPQARAALEVLNNPNAPDYLQSIAASMIKQVPIPTTGTPTPGGRRRSSGGGSAPAKPPRLYGQPFQNAEGVWGKLDGYGKFWPIEAMNGAAATPASAAPVAALPPDPVLPADPAAPPPLGAPSAGSMSDEDLLKKYLGSL